MKRLFTIWLLLVASVAHARGTPEADTFLWQVSKEGRPVSYLLGTIHIGKVNDTLPEPYLTALRQVNRLVVESNSNDTESPGYQQDLAAMQSMLYESNPLHKTIGDVRIILINRALRKGQEPLQIDRSTHMQPWAVWMMLESMYSPKNYSYRYGIDNLLIQAAKKQNKPVVALERLEGMRYIESVPEEKVVRRLDKIIAHHNAILQEEADLVEQYQQQQAKQIWADINNPNKQMRYISKQDRAYWEDFMFNRLLAERNQNWLGKLVVMLPEQPTLVAVGAAHLFGEQGLILRLRQIGYRVEPLLLKPAEN